MSINPDNITTIRVDQLAESTLNLTNEFPHSDGATLKKATIQSLVDLVATAVGSGSGVGFLPISVTDGQQLPNVPADPSFFLCGVGTFLNINGYPNIVCTEELNAIMSVSDHWEIAVEIPINVDLQSIGISQSVNDGVLDKAPSENAVYDFISQWLPKSSLGYFDYADLATQTTPITVAPDTETLLTNDTLGDDTHTSQPPYGVSAIWVADSDEFNFQQLSVGDTVDIRVHLKTTTTSANQKYHIDMKFAFDGPDEFENRIFSQYVKNASEDEQSFVTTLYIGSESVRTYPARLYITSDDDATVEVVGWFCRVFRKSVNIVDIITDEAPIDGLTYGRKDAEWVEVSGGGSVGTLQQVTDNGNRTTNEIISTTGLSIEAIASSGKVQRIVPVTGIGDDQNFNFPNKVGGGSIALTSDIPTVDATPTDGSSNAVSSNGVFDGLANKQNTLTETNFGSFINGLTAKNTLVDADEVVSDDSADSNKAKKTTWLNVWTNYLKPKADALYQAILTDVPIKSIIADYTNSSGVTGTASETLISSYKINANTLSALDFMNMTLRLLKTGATAGYLITIRIGTTSTFSTSLTQIAQYGNTLSTGVDVNFQRYFKIEGGQLKGSNFTFNILTNQGVSVNYSENSTSFNVSVDNWIFISVKPQSSNSDVITQSIFKITN